MKMSSLEIIQSKIKCELSSEMSKAFSIESNERGSDVVSLFYRDVHRNVINSLIDLYLKGRCLDYNKNKCRYLIENHKETKFYNFTSNFNLDDIPSICEELHLDYLNSEYSIRGNVLIKKKSKTNLLELGAVYTPSELAYSITLRTLKNLNPKTPNELKLLDFATGTGRFYRHLVKCCKELWCLSPDSSMTNNIYAIDIDPIAINICRLNAFSLLEEKTLANLKKLSNHIICKDALLEDITTSPKIKFPKEFDAVVSNPPYLILKPNRSKMNNDTVENITKMVKYFRSSNLYHYSIEGMLNLYQISLEAMVNMLKDKGELGVICPSTLFADISASKLRKFLLSRHSVTYIKYFSENEQLFYNVTQATCIFHLKKNGITNTIQIEQEEKKYDIFFDDVKVLMPHNWEIPSIDLIEWQILKKLNKIPKLCQYTNIRNKRGELDLSMYKKFITHTPTPYRLVRGNMISENGIKDINHEYVLPSFLENKSSGFLKYDLGKKRLICQQISNQAQRIRLRFVVCEPNDILGNSCNYISVEQEQISTLMCILNSALLNWRFKVTSTNNHINNYELDELPIFDLSKWDKSILQFDSLKQNEVICQLYGLNKQETNFILSNYYETIQP